MKKLALLLLYSSSILGASEGVQPFFREPSTVGKYTPTEQFRKPISATSMIRGESLPFCFWYNPVIWSVEKRSEELSEKVLFHSSTELMGGLLIAEQVPIPHEEIKMLVWENAENQFNEVHFLYDDTRLVNDLVVYCFQWSGVYGGSTENKDWSFKRGKRYVFYEYIYSTDQGTIQLSAHCEAEDFENLERLLTNFLNGLTMCPD